MFDASAKSILLDMEGLHTLVGNLYFYEDKDTRFDCVWEELVEQDSIRQDSKKCKEIGRASCRERV